MTAVHTALKEIKNPWKATAPRTILVFVIAFSGLQDIHHLQVEKKERNQQRDVVEIIFIRNRKFR